MAGARRKVKEQRNNAWEEKKETFAIMLKGSLSQEWDRVFDLSRRVSD